MEILVKTTDGEVGLSGPKLAKFDIWWTMYPQSYLRALLIPKNYPNYSKIIRTIIDVYFLHHLEHRIVVLTYLYHNSEWVKFVYKYFLNIITMQ